MRVLNHLSYIEYFWPPSNRVNISSLFRKMVGGSMAVKSQFCFYNNWLSLLGFVTVIKQDGDDALWMHNRTERILLRHNTLYWLTEKWGKKKNFKCQTPFPPFPSNHKITLKLNQSKISISFNFLQYPNLAKKKVET